MILSWVNFVLLVIVLVKLNELKHKIDILQFLNKKDDK